MFYSPNLRDKIINVLSIRVQDSVSIAKSLCFKIRLPSTDVDVKNLKWTGWEPNDKGKLIPRLSEMAASMDPER